MNSAVVAEHFSHTKELEYINFVERLGVSVHFSSDKWICDTLCRAPSEKVNMYTLYFDRIPSPHKDTVKFFAAISLIRSKSIATVKAYICDLIRFFDFWTLYGGSDSLQLCNEFAAARFYQYLEAQGFAEARWCFGRCEVLR